MTNQTVLERDEISGLDAALGGVEGLSRLLVEQTFRIIPVILSLPGEHRRRWMECVAAVAAGRTEKVQAERDGLTRSLKNHLDALRRTMHLAAIAESLSGEPVARAAELPAALADLERLRADVYGRWQTVEDLEDLAAASFPLPAARLQELAAKHPAPQVWHDQQGEPF